MTNLLKQKLADGGFALGAGVNFNRNPAVVRIIAAAGYDFVFVDMQHSSLDLETVSAMCEVARAEGLVPLVRPAHKIPDLVGRVLDVGATGIMMHDVRPGDDVLGARERMLYPPDGSRGSFYGGVFDYRGAPSVEALAAVNDSLTLVVQVESLEAVEGIEDIVEGGGIDVVEVGRLDLACALGVPGEKGHPRVLRAVDTVVEVCTRHGIPVGVGCASPEDAAQLADRGCRFLLYPMDLSLLMNGYSASARVLRSLAGRDVGVA
ncbi:MAG TPA: aldolase/citrate lyase family protein [Cellulomonas sp.]